VRYCLRSEAAGRSHIETIAAQGQLVVSPFHGVHFPSAQVLACDAARLILEGYAVVGALWYEVGILLTRGVEEVQLLPPVALALRL
jgi:hypothetical protein